MTSTKGQISLVLKLGVTFHLGPYKGAFYANIPVSLQQALRSKLQFSITFHPQTDGQSEATIQTLEDMLRVCAL